MCLWKCMKHIAYHIYHYEASCPDGSQQLPLFPESKHGELRRNTACSCDNRRSIDSLNKNTNNIGNFVYRLTFLALPFLFCCVPVTGASVPNIPRSDNCALLSSSCSLSSRCDQESMCVTVQRICYCPI